MFGYEFWCCRERNHIQHIVRAYVDRSWKYINRSQTHECGNWDWGRAITRKRIHKLDFHCSVMTLCLCISTLSTCCNSRKFIHRFSWKIYEKNTGENVVIALPLATAGGPLPKQGFHGGMRVSAEGEKGGREGGGRGDMSRICSKIHYLAFLHGN